MCRLGLAFLNMQHFAYVQLNSFRNRALPVGSGWAKLMPPKLYEAPNQPERAGVYPSPLKISHKNLKALLVEGPMGDLERRRRFTQSEATDAGGDHLRR
jgi:hypothetical protein